MLECSLVRPRRLRVCMGASCASEGAVKFSFKHAPGASTQLIFSVLYPDPRPERFYDESEAADDACSLGDRASNILEALLAHLRRSAAHVRSSSPSERAHCFVQEARKSREEG